jgi:hypothetical protein
MPTLECPIPVNAWKEASRLNGHPRSSPHTHSSTIADDEEGAWRPVIDEIVAMQHLGDDWDGLGADAPSQELVASAVGLAYLLHDCGIDPPAAVAPGPSGTVLFVWHFADGAYSEIEIDRPLHAEVMLLEPNKPARHWSLPSQE